MSRLRALFLARRGARGQAAIQFLAGLPITLIAILACYKVFVTITTVERVENAARTGVRAASLKGDPSICRSQVLASMPQWLTKQAGSSDHLPHTPNQRVNIDCKPVHVRTGMALSCHLMVEVPLISPSMPFNYPVDQRVYMPE